jgi:RNA binding exosome subunit
MTLENQVLEMVRDRFDAQDVMLNEIKESIRDHVTKDEAYWRQIDDQKAQLKLVKWIGGTGIFSSAVIWIWQKFLH